MDKPRNSNRRRSFRQKTKKNSKVYCYGGKLGLGPNIAIQILNLSETGMRLRVQTECRRGQELHFHLTSLCHRKPVSIVGKVVWCIPNAENDYSIGVEFLKPLKYRDLLML